MIYYLAVFRSQTQTHEFKQLLSSYGVPAMVVSTPRQAEVSCGLSVKFFGGNSLNIAKDILGRRQFASFVAFFIVREGAYGEKQIDKI